MDPIKLLSELDWSATPVIGQRYWDELREVFEGDDHAAKVDMWHRMCAWSGVVRVIVDAEVTYLRNEKAH